MSLKHLISVAAVVFSLFAYSTCSKSEEILETFSVGCESAGLLCEPAFEKTITTSGILKMQYHVSAGHCGAIKLRIFVDDNLIKTVGPLGPSGSSNPMETELIDLGPLPSGAHTLRLKAEGVPDEDCIIDRITSWGGTARIIFQAIDTLEELRFVNSRTEQLAEEIMRGEAFHVILTLNSKPETNPVLKISSGTGASPIQRTTEIDDELGGNGLIAYKTILATLESGKYGGSFESVGNSLTTSYGGYQITLPIVEPKIDIFVMEPRTTGHEKQLDKVIGDEPIHVEVFIPRKLVGPTKKYNTKVKVEFRAKKTGVNNTVELQNTGNQYGRFCFATPESITLNDIVPATFGNDLEFIKHDELTLTLLKDNQVTTTIDAFMTDTQMAIAILRANFVFMRDQYEIMIKTPISTTSKEALHRKNSVAKNAIVIMDYDRRAANDSNWNDWKTLAIGIELQNLLLTDSSKWSKTPESSWRKNRYGIVMPFLQEQRAELQGLQNASTRIENALYTVKKIVIEGAYSAFTTFTGARTAAIVFFKHDEFGRRVTRTQQILAGVETASMFLLTGAFVYKGIAYNRATMSAGAKGKQVKFIKRDLTRIKGGGVRAEDWLTEVYGTGPGGGSRKTFFTSTSLKREYDGYNHVQKIPFEAKTGRVKGTDSSGRALKQLKKDVDILKNNAELKRVEWHFFVSRDQMLKAEKNGKSLKDAMKESFGGDKTLLDAIKKANQELRPLGKKIRIVEHNNLVF